eukprot:CFRG7837T1
MVTGDRQPLVSVVNVRESVSSSSGSISNEQNDTSNYCNRSNSIRLRSSRTVRHRRRPSEESLNAYEEEFDGGRQDSFDTKVVDGEKFSFYKLWQFTGPGFLMCIAYVDPGNIESDLQAGAQGGYQLLWVLFWSTFVGGIMQCLAARVGVVSGKHLAQLCREEYPRAPRYVLWIMTEIAIIGSDIQEVVGSAIALGLLSHGWIPLWLGVLITAADTFTFLFLDGYGIRRLEFFFYFLLAVMVVTFGAEYVISGPETGQVIEGILFPRLDHKLTSQAVGMIGAVIMPHNLFLHSALVQSRAVNQRDKSAVRQANMYYVIETIVALICSFLINLFVMAVFAKGFFNQPGIETKDIGLHNAGQYLGDRYGQIALYVWAIGLLAAGQSSTMTGTYAGQFVMSGFLNLKIEKWKRVLITRTVAIVPAILVASIAKEDVDGLDEMLNVLQSIQLPFALLPLIRFTSDEFIMGDFTNGRRLQGLVRALSLVIICVNIYLIIDKTSDLLPHTFVVFTSMGIFGIVYIGFCLYVAFPELFHSNYSALLGNDGSFVRLANCSTVSDDEEDLYISRDEGSSSATSSIVRIVPAAIKPSGHLETLPEVIAEHTPLLASEQLSTSPSYNVIHPNEHEHTS